MPGATFLDIHTDLCGKRTGTNGRHPLPDPHRLSAALGAACISNSTQVVAYDDCGGTHAARLWWLLRWLGHNAVAVLDGGWSRWVAEGRPLAVSTTLRAAAEFKAEPHASMLVDTAFITANLDSKAALLIDARAPSRFRGESEPHHGVAGHISGALNRPLSRNLNQDGLFQPPQLLRAEFEHLLAGRLPRDVVHYCGSGVSACHNLLAMEIAGLCHSRLYPGSWSEWIDDPSRPVECGDVQLSGSSTDQGETL